MTKAQVSIRVPSRVTNPGNGFLPGAVFRPCRSLWLAGLATLITIAGIFSPAGRPDAAVAADENPAGGEITLRVVDGKQFAAIVARHKNQVVLVDFWATYCGPCRKQFPHTVELSDKYGAQGLATISVCCDDPEKDRQALDFLKKNKARFENLRSKFGSDEETFTTFDIEGGALPHYKLYDRKGKLRHTFGTDPDAERQFTTDDIDAAVQKLLSEGA